MTGLLAFSGALPASRGHQSARGARAPSPPTPLTSRRGPTSPPRANLGQPRGGLGPRPQAPAAPFGGAPEPRAPAPGCRPLGRADSSALRHQTPPPHQSLPPRRPSAALPPPHARPAALSSARSEPPPCPDPRCAARPAGRPPRGMSPVGGPEGRRAGRGVCRAVAASGGGCAGWCGGEACRGSGRGGPGAGDHGSVSDAEHLAAPGAGSVEEPA